jgi:hypothetical protein
MNSPAFSESTTFTRDVEGRYICNTLDEAKASADTGKRADAKPFDIIIVGGGTFGAALASALFERDKERKHRILVLEGGPFTMHEHVQNIPLVGFTGPDAIHLATIQQWQASNDEKAFRNWNREVWGLAWHSPHKFPGLAYCVGGRSLFWGGLVTAVARCRNAGQLLAYLCKSRTQECLFPPGIRADRGHGDQRLHPGRTALGAAEETVRRHDCQHGHGRNSAC